MLPICSVRAPVMLVVRATLLLLVISTGALCPQSLSTLLEAQF